MEQGLFASKLIITSIWTCFVIAFAYLAYALTNKFFGKLVLSYGVFVITLLASIPLFLLIHQGSANIQAKNAQENTFITSGTISELMPYSDAAHISLASVSYELKTHSNTAHINLISASYVENLKLPTSSLVHLNQKRSAASSFTTQNLFDELLISIVLVLSFLGTRKISIELIEWVKHRKTK